MCSFSRTVDFVNDTYVFARDIGEAQIFMYDMAYAAETELSIKEAVELHPPCWRFSMVGSYDNIDSHAGGAMPGGQFLGETWRTT